MRGRGLKLTSPESGDMAEKWEKAKSMVDAERVRLIALISSTADAVDKALLFLSGGALVFSMSFVGTLAPKKLWLPWLFASWIFFAISLATVLLAMKSSEKGLTKSLKNQTDLYNDLARAELYHSDDMPEPVIENTLGTIGWAKAWNQIALWSFVLGVILLGVFAAHNLWPAKECLHPNAV
jgi:hypothetical protein